MRLLILGGTKFVGYSVARAAVARGWDVTVFNRGISGDDPPATFVVRGDRTDDRDVQMLATCGTVGCGRGHLGLCPPRRAGRVQAA